MNGECTGFVGFALWEADNYPPDKQSVPPPGRPAVPADTILEALISHLVVEDRRAFSIQLNEWKSVSTVHTYRRMIIVTVTVKMKILTCIARVIKVSSSNPSG